MRNASGQRGHVITCGRRARLEFVEMLRKSAADRPAFALRELILEIPFIAERRLAVIEGDAGAEGFDLAITAGETSGEVSTWLWGCLTESPVRRYRRRHAQLPTSAELCRQRYLAWFHSEVAELRRCRKDTRPAALARCFGLPPRRIRQLLAGEIRRTRVAEVERATAARGQVWMLHEILEGDGR